MFRPLCVLMNRRSCSSRGRPRHAGCRWNVRNDSSSPLRRDDLLHGVHAGGANELVLEILDADVEAEPLHVGPRETGAEPGALERATEHRLLTGVDEAREPHVQPVWAVPIEEGADRLRAAHRHDGNALLRKAPAEAPCERFHRPLVADPLDEDDGRGLGRCRHERRRGRRGALDGDAGVLEQAAVRGVRVGMLEDLERLLRVDDELEGLSALVDDGDGERVVLGVPDEVYVDSLVRAVRQLAAAH